MTVLASNLVPFVILLIVLAAFAVIALIAFIIHRALKPKLKDDENKIDEKQAVQENLDRFLQPVDDEKLADEIANYQDEEESIEDLKDKIDENTPKDEK